MYLTRISAIYASSEILINTEIQMERGANAPHKHKPKAENGEVSSFKTNQHGHARSMIDRCHAFGKEKLSETMKGE